MDIRVRGRFRDLERAAAEILPLAFDRDDRVLPHPIRPAVLDSLAGMERDRQADPEKLRRIGIIARRHR